MNYEINKPENIKYLSKIFSSSLIKSAIKRENYSKIQSIITESGFESLLAAPRIIDLYTEAFNLLTKHYRNEYIYKSAIIDQILNGQHNENSTIFSELGVDNCKADIAIFNGTSTVYEIKTEYDSFDRLDRQLSAYRKAFDKIYVITSERHLKKLITAVDENIGILILSDDIIIKQHRKSSSNRHNIESSVLFDLLRRNEALKIIEKEFGTILNVPNTEIYSVSKEIFSSIPSDKAHVYTIQSLKDRGKKLRNFLLNVPTSFNSFAISSNLTKKDQLNFFNFLNRSII